MQTKESATSILRPVINIVDPHIRIAGQIIDVVGGVIPALKPSKRSSGVRKISMLCLW